ncbi:hypothetical protein PUR61_03280 [Streptomyces sp. BE20]|uniref:hypothetical protein n=1 Tax=Streptomyces sp. BE20 TaxID=3002525 RepID=UPI002E7904C2|nr:hypothetical protein [Streptomyces sp. BE20]MEE1821225.1 hypothetical protein [Streptomyces sp. BE20]
MSGANRTTGKTKVSIAYRELKREVNTLAKAVTRGSEQHRQLATHLAEAAKDTGRIADNITAVKVDTATVAETRELSKTMQGLGESAAGYAGRAEDTAQAARAAEGVATTTHEGIQQAADRAPVGMADRGWYTQE